MVTVANPCLSGGTLEIFLETMIPAPLVFVYGEAPVARALAAVARSVGYDGVLAPSADTPIPLDAGAVVVASHGRDEIEVLTAAVRAGIPYVALVASRKRAAAVLAELPVSDEEKARIHAPAGLDIGARTAPEIALSVLAELIAARPRQTAPPSGAPPTADPPAVEPVQRNLLVAVDPVCAMDVAVSPDALQYEHAGTKYYFCGSGCRRAFIDDPARYVA
jgi:xanthine dehydrogenase accessory factor